MTELLAVCCRAYHHYISLMPSPVVTAELQFCSQEELTLLCLQH